MGNVEEKNKESLKQTIDDADIIVLFTIKKNIMTRSLFNCGSLKLYGILHNAIDLARQGFLNNNEKI